MKIKELLVPDLTNRDLNIRKIKSDDSMHYTKENINNFICEDGIYMYIKKKNTVELFREEVEINNAYILSKDEDNMYIKCDSPREGEIFVNELDKTYVKTNILPLHHTLLSYEKHVIKQNNNSPIELIIEQHNSVFSKTYFIIKDSFSLNSKIVKDELNKLISFLV